MKRTVFIVVLLVLSIGIPVLAESSDSLSTESENPVLQKQELKLPWYKTVKYEIGYTGGICLNSTPLGQWHDMIHNNFTWFNTFDISIILHEKHLGFGFEYGWWPHLTNREGLTLEVPDSEYAYDNTSKWSSKWAIYYNGIFIKYYKTKSFYYGISINHFIANSEEILYAYSDSAYISYYIQRECMGGDIFCGLERHILLKRFEIIPFLKLQIGHAVEYKNNLPLDWESKKLTIGTSGVFVGIKIRFGGER